jgi:ATP-dependent RNA helicase RhlE
MDVGFEALGLLPPLLRALDGSNYDECTPIQKQAIPLLLDGNDLMGCAQTGTGKTAAFALPTLHRLAITKPGGQHSKVPLNSTDSGKPRPLRCLVLAPTRELAAQIGASFNKYGKFVGLRVAVIHGGVSQVPQEREIRRGVDILIATPGRLLDLMGQGITQLMNVEILVIDEADQMFDMGFFRDLKKIIAKVPIERQTMMFSATMPDPIRELANECLNHPKLIKVAKVSSPVEAIKQSVFFVDSKAKSGLLVRYLKSNTTVRSIVFVRTKHGANQLVKVLGQHGIQAVAIHGNKSQGARTRSLDQFRSDNPPILVATDIAARGIDVADVSHVFNFHLPTAPEAYVHRIGRTARAGKAGIAVSFCAPDEIESLRDIQGLIDRDIEIDTSFPNHSLPSDELVRQLSAKKKSGVAAPKGKMASRGASRGRSGKRTGVTTSKSSGRTGMEAVKSKKKLVRK